MNRLTRQSFLQMLDTMGVAASTLCTVHCIATALFVGLLPVIGLGFVNDPSVHQLLAIAVLFFCLTAIVPGYLRHRRTAILVLMVVGLGLVLFATFLATPVLASTFEIPIISAGNIMVIGAHWLNRRSCACP
jgi:hypothetical protein